MVRFTVRVVIAALLATSVPALANPPKTASPSQTRAAKPSDQVLVDGLNALGTAINRSGQQASTQAKPGGNGQVDPNASSVAISKVCNHDNPSAQHAPFCQPNSLLDRFKAILIE